MNLFIIFIIIASFGIGSSCKINKEVEEIWDKEILDIEIHEPGKPVFHALVEMIPDNELPYLDDK